jgi:O-antigen ligase
MYKVPAWLLAAVPLVIAPGVSFYFDVIPRLSLLLVIVAFVFIKPSRVVHFCTNGPARVFCIAAAVYAISLVISTVLSVNPSFSIYGSTWRRFGLITQVALLILTVMLAADRVMRELLRAFTALGFAASVYGIFQYFGVDPLLDSSRYHVGEGVWMIVRPPGTAGHADYFAVYLVMVAFTAGAIVVSDSSRVWRVFATVVMPVAGVATIMTGTRSALVGAVCGLIVVALRFRPRLTVARVAAAVVIAGAFVGFYLSPAGERLRARVRWSTEDPRGGARLWLWRDSLRMVARRPIVGFGPETYGLEFPQFQSLDLARAYPDFHHESPHNLELDVLVTQGMPGGIALAVMLGAAMVAGLRAPPELRKLATVLLGGLVAVLVSHQFSSPTVVTALCVSVSVACLLALAPPLPHGRGSERGWTAMGIVISVVFLGYAFRLSVADWFLAKTRDALTGNSTVAAAEYYERAAQWLPGASADLYYSRAMAAAAGKAPDPASAVRAWQQAIAAGQRAVRSTDEHANAAYNLAAMHAAANDFARTEESLRTAVAKAPNWFKPHWMLARVLALSGRLEEAEKAAGAALERNGNVNPEVRQTLDEIRRKRSQAR